MHTVINAAITKRNIIISCQTLIICLSFLPEQPPNWYAYYNNVILFLICFYSYFSLFNACICCLCVNNRRRIFDCDYRISYFQRNGCTCRCLKFNFYRECARLSVLLLFYSYINQPSLCIHTTLLYIPCLYIIKTHHKFIITQIVHPGSGNHAERRTSGRSR